MPKIPETLKSERLERVYLLLQRYPDGLREREIADMLNIERRTVHNYLQELDMQGKIYKDGRLWYVLSPPSMVLRKFDLQPEEAMVLYLAARLFVKQSDQRNEVAELVLMRLAEILSDDMSLGNDLREAAAELARRPQVAGYENVFRTVMQGYIYRRKVKLLYMPYQARPFETVFSPYLLEPSAIGFATYAIGHSEIVGQLRTYKIERIRRAQLTREEYTIPADFPGLKLLRNAWSIYYGEKLTQVVLRFHPDVARRVQETNWHPSQQIQEDDQKPGYLLLSVDVANTTDLKPWIRTWGVNCEVLEPVRLRDELMGEARKLAELYGWYTSRGPHHHDEDDPLGLADTLNDYFG